jgi:hypothetical protein
MTDADGLVHKGLAERAWGLDHHNPSVLVSPSRVPRQLVPFDRLLLYRSLCRASRDF